MYVATIMMNCSVIWTNRINVGPFSTHLESVGATTEIRITKYCSVRVSSKQNKIIAGVSEEKLRKLRLKQKHREKKNKNSNKLWIGRSWKDQLRPRQEDWTTIKRSSEKVKVNIDENPDEGQNWGKPENNDDKEAVLMSLLQKQPILKMSLWNEREWNWHHRTTNPVCIKVRTR